jgi:hypothetical protein
VLTPRDGRIAHADFERPRTHVAAELEGQRRTLLTAGTGHVPDDRSAAGRREHTNQQVAAILRMGRARGNVSRSTAGFASSVRATVKESSSNTSSIRPMSNRGWRTVTVWPSIATREKIGRCRARRSAAKIAVARVEYCEREQVWERVAPARKR